MRPARAAHPGSGVLKGVSMSENGLPSLLERHWAESALAIGAVIIAAVSLWVAWDSVRTNRELVASSSWPFVQFTATVPAAAQPRYLALIVSNDGIGPAKLESFELFLAGSRPALAPAAAANLLCARTDGRRPDGKPRVPAPRPGPGDLHRLGDRAAGGRRPPDPHLHAQRRQRRALDVLSQSFTGNISVRYCFCSAFNECWQVSARMGAQRDLNPPRVPYCPRPGAPYDNTSD